MKIQDFIRFNRKRIDQEIKGKPPGFAICDKERETWVRNCGCLRELAAQCGVKL
jgi:hypothetical protein